MSERRCLELLGPNPPDEARALCRDTDTQRCLAFYYPEKSGDVTLDNLVACFGTGPKTEEASNVRLRG